MLLTQAQGAGGAQGSLGVQSVLAPIVLKPASAGGSPAERIEAARLDQEKLIEAAGALAKNRADRLRMAFRLAGLDPTLYAGRGDALGGPLIDAKDPRSLAAVLDVDEDFAKRIQHAAVDLSDLRGLTKAAETIPWPTPPTTSAKASGFGRQAESLHRPARLPFRPGFRRRIYDAGPRHRPSASSPLPGYGRATARLSRSTMVKDSRPVTRTWKPSR